MGMIQSSWTLQVRVLLTVNRENYRLKFWGVVLQRYTLTSSSWLSSSSSCFSRITWQFPLPSWTPSPCTASPRSRPKSLSTDTALTSSHTTPTQNLSSCRNSQHIWLRRSLWSGSEWLKFNLDKILFLNLFVFLPFSFFNSRLLTAYFTYGVTVLRYCKKTCNHGNIVAVCEKYWPKIVKKSSFCLSMTTLKMEWRQIFS